MTDISFINLLPRQIAKHHIRFKSVTKKFQRTASSIDFIQKALYYEVTQTFAKVKGQFITLKDQHYAEKKVLLFPLNFSFNRTSVCFHDDWNEKAPCY